MSIDTVLKAEVLAELEWEPMVDPSHIGVTVRDGLVTLTGHVKSYWQKRAAEKAAGRVRGVKAVAGDITVRLPVEVSRGDEEIAAAAVNRLDWDSVVPHDAVKVLVTDGNVTLSGTVAQAYQRAAAGQAVQSLWGVLSLANDITVMGPPPRPVNPNQIADDIRRALNRGWFAADTVHVAARGGTVTLSGSAATLRDRELAVATAWSAPGTMVVQDHIRIG
ncbi:BON domain-containing protein [Paracoccaceae bacterium]